MKLFITTLLLSFTTSITLSAQGSIPQPTHELQQRTFNPAQALKYSGEIFNYYDNNGNLYESKSNFWNGLDWELGLRTYYTLNAEGLPVQILDRSWDPNLLSLTDQYRTTLGYEPDGQENYKKEEEWDKVAEVWVPLSLKNTTYGLTGNALQALELYYQNGQEAEAFQRNYSYDATDRLLQCILQTRVDGVWESTQKVDYQYSGSSEDFATSETSYWNKTQMVWRPAELRITQTVSSTERLTIAEIFNGQNWVVNYRNRLIYNVDGQLTVYDFESWDPGSSSWYTQVRFENFYNNDKSIKQFKYFQNDFSTGTVYQSIQSDFDYGTYAVGAKTPSLDVEVDVFPNPASDQLNISVSGQSECSLSLLDIHGKLVARTKTLGQQAKMAIANQPAGMYFLKVEQDGGAKILPVVKR